jgi:hypothetical protein
MRPAISNKEQWNSSLGAHEQQLLFKQQGGQRQYQIRKKSFQMLFRSEGTKNFKRFFFQSDGTIFL